MPSRIQEINSSLGIEINSINLAKNASFSINELTHLFAQHHLLIIRNQQLNEEQLIEISRLFGEPAPALVPTYRLEKYPLITRHTNVKDNDRLPKGVVAPEYVFHADSYFTSNPSKATLFYCLKAPTHGGETHFVDMCSAYDRLDAATKSFISDKKVSYKNAFVNQPAVSHPLVRIHPITKRKALFVNIHRALGIDGMSDEDAIALVEKLYIHATEDEYVYKHQYRDGDLLIWNNVTTMHAATPIVDSEERLLYRILTKGENAIE